MSRQQLVSVGLKHHWVAVSGYTKHQQYGHCQQGADSNSVQNSALTCVCSVRVLGKLLRLLQGELHWPSWIVGGVCVMGRRVNGVVRMDPTGNMTMSVLMHGVLNGIRLVMRRCLLGARGGGAGL
jgi:hypothetical protein